MPLIGGLIRTAMKAGIAKKVLDELRKPANQEKLKVIGARVLTEVRRPENQEKVRRAARVVTSKVGRRSPARP